MRRRLSDIDKIVFLGNYLISKHILTKGSEMVNDLRNRQFEKAMAGNSEFCVLCFRDMGFAKTLHVDDPQRSQNGAQYVEGAGQICGDCNKPRS